MQMNILPYFYLVKTTEFKLLTKTKPKKPMTNKIYQLFEYAYIVMFFFAIYMVVTNWDTNRDQAYLFAFFGVVFLLLLLLLLDFLGEFLLLLFLLLLLLFLFGVPTFLVLPLLFIYLLNNIYIWD